MPRLGPIPRRDLIRYLRHLGFDGPYTGGRHQYLIRGTRRLWVPNPRQGDISRPFLERVLNQAGVTRDEWEAL